jgi:predicted enzyme related to lactoylglutathione lyase
MAGISFNGGLVCAFQVTDLARAIKWYSDVLGCKLIYKVDEIGWCEMTSPTPGVAIGLSQVEKITGRGNCKLTFGVTDVEGSRATLESKKVKFEGPTVEIPGMVKLATFFDPDDNPHMFYQDLQKH